MNLTKLFTLLAMLGLTSAASAEGFLIEPSSPNFMPGEVLLAQPDDAMGNPVPPAPGIMSVSTSSATSLAVGLTESGSIFGGNAVNGNGAPNPDTYIYTYSPASDAANFAPAAGTLLNDDGDVLTGLPLGEAGTYRVYATWPTTGNISFEAPTSYVLNDGTSDVLSVMLNQDTDAVDGLLGDEWSLLGEFELDPTKTYTLTQTNVPDEQVGLGGTVFANGFVSMRSSGVLFQPVPEPTTALLALVGIAAVARRR